MENTLSAKLGSLLVHVEEFFSMDGHELDRIEIKNRLEDPEIKQWMAGLAAQGFLPVKRHNLVPRPMRRGGENPPPTEEQRRNRPSPPPAPPEPHRRRTR